MDSRALQPGLQLEASGLVTLPLTLAEPAEPLTKRLLPSQITFLNAGKVLTIQFYRLNLNTIGKAQQLQQHCPHQAVTNAGWEAYLQEMAGNFVQELDISPDERLQVQLDCAWLQQGTSVDFSAPHRTCLSGAPRSGGCMPFASLLVMLASQYQASQALRHFVAKANQYSH